MRLRKHILRQRRLGKLRFSGEQDPVHVFAETQRRSTKRSRKQGTVVMQLSQAAQPSEPGETPSTATQIPARRRQADVTIVPVDLGDLKVQNR
ncbi:hypothetical protein P0D88_47770 [Paraburkholderia sp. RL18-103-BIB-C]|jgi:hypothetical protein|uniref:hypothetical protein n=1 Tax=Paraburkholderia sp. RL18-103-BIB-C TaxID=3031637 RepID=UPI0038B7D0FD